MKVREIQPSAKEFIGIKIPELPPPELPIKSPDTESMPQSSDYSINRFQLVIEQQINNYLPLLQVHVNPIVDSVRINTKQVIYGDDENFEPNYSIACHQIASNQNQNVVDAAISIASYLDHTLPDIRLQATRNGYVNVELPSTVLAKSILADVEQLKDRYGEQNIGNQKVVVIDLSSPNIAKHFSVGHLRSTVIGESIARIYETSGYTVIRDNHLGDWGTQFGKLGRAFELWHNQIPELHNPETAVDGLYKLYVRMNDEIEKQKSGNQHSVLEEEGRAWFRRLEIGDEQAKSMFNWACALSMQEFKRVYEKLGSSFNYQLGESYYVSMLSQVVAQLHQKGLVQDIGDNALAVQFKKSSKDKPLEFINRPLTHEEKEKIQQKKSDVELLVVSKRDGASVYSTRDLAALVARTEWFSPAKIIYVVGESQQEYFKMVFATFQKMAGEIIPELIHVPFGLVTLPGGGKMSTRQGKVIFLEDVLNESIKRAKEVLLKSNRQISETEADDIARKVGIGAVIFMDIGQGRERNIQFDWNTALSLEGKSAPYIQYTHARCCSLIHKAEEKHLFMDSDINPVFSQNKDLHKKEKNLTILLGMYPEVIRHALTTHEPSKISEYLLKLTDTFNSFYTTNPILTEIDPHLRNTRLRLVKATAQVVKNGLNLLNIDAPEKM